MPAHSPALSPPSGRIAAQVGALRPSEPAPIVRFQAVRKAFGDGRPVLRDLTLDVRAGEYLTLLGPSGAGKSTALMLLAGFAQPDAGSILLDGRDVTGLPPFRRGMGMVFQGSALFPHMTVAGNVAFPLEVRGMPAAQRGAAVARALEMVRLSALADRRPAQLSGGQAQRVALARALVFGPALVLLDEPLAALDRALREEMQDELQRVHRQLGVTMLHVTHDQAEALALSDRIAVLHDGVIRQVDTPRTLYDDPADLVVAGFVGENNLLPGRVDAVDEDGIADIVLDGGQAVAAQAERAALQPGARCVVAVRPELVAVVGAMAADLGQGAVPARLVEHSYRGDHYRLRVALEGGAMLTVKRPAGFGPGGLAAGQVVAVAWQPHQARAFAEPAR